VLAATPMFEVELRPGLPGGRWACLRELRGRDEAALGDAAELAMVALVDQLLVATPGTTVAPGMAGALALADRDRLLAAIYRQHFGDRVDGRHACAGCGEAFGVGLSLAALEASLTEGAAVVTGPDEVGAFRLPGRGRFRLPTTQDRRAVVGLDVDAARAALARACRLDADAGDDDELETGMEAAGPLLDLDLDASCPSCGTAAVVHVDIVSHLHGVLRQERRWLVREVHCLARAYGWGLAEILDLPRSERRAFVSLNEPAVDLRGWA
jgi:hypothetical protein